MDRRKPVSAVIYDLDGLLLNTEPFYTQASQLIAARYGKVYDWSLKSRMMGKRATDSARIFTQSLEIPLTAEEYLESRRALLEELFPQAEPLPGAVRLTEHLHKNGVPQAVATSSDRKHYALKTTRHRQWFSIFSCIVMGDDSGVQHGKPAPDIFLVTAERLGLQPEICLVLEDSPVGVQAARAAGMRVIAIPDPQLTSEDFRDADQILRNIAEFDPRMWGLPPFRE